MNQSQNDRKGQISLEFIIISAIVLLLFMIMGLLLYQKYTEWNDLRLQVTGQDVTQRTANAINQLAIVGDGYSKYLTLKTRYPGDEFNISFRKNLSIVFVEQEWTWQAPLLTTRVYCCLDMCESTGNTTIMHLNQTRKLEIFNRRNNIFIGEICPQIIGFPQERVNI